MADEDGLRIISTDRFECSLIIGFSDGRCGRYSVDLLHGMLAQSEELLEPVATGDSDEPDVVSR